MGYKVAIVGATGNVGQEMLNILAEREFPADEVVALASRRSQGKRSVLRRPTLKCKTLDTYDFSDTDFCLMSAGLAFPRNGRPKIGRQNCMVIDNSSCWRYDAEVPLVVPEVNAHVLDDYLALNKRKNIIANPNCSTAQLVVALKPLQTMPASSASSSPPISRFPAPARKPWTSCGTRPAASSLPIRRAEKFTKQIAFNVIPHIDVFMEDGTTKEEWKMVAETKKILDPKIKLTATCVRVPVFVGHSEAINIEFEDRSPPKRPARSCARRPAAWWSTSMRTAAT